ncbi:OstA-like protein [Porphyromonadaceae bacterium W3.11]|nr:OstA-like protein [Porphyromonadaceae bacterium W3.11]
MKTARVRRQIITTVALLMLLLLASQASNTGLGRSFLPGGFADTVPPLKRNTAIDSVKLSNAANSGGKERIFIEHVDVWRFDKEINPDAQILVGNVQFRHKDALMFCDSALMYEADNRFEAYGNVRIEQGDSLFIYCNYLDYDGQIMLARLRELVRMEHGDNTLYTDSLDYDREAGVGYYFDYGSIVDTLNILSSVYGEYSTATKCAIFNDSVVLENPNFILRSDTLNYDTETKIATILGPTEIVGDSGVIHATRGLYDTDRDRAYLMDKPVIESGTRWMTGDSIFYDRVGQLVEMFKNVELKDTVEHASLRGDYAEYHEDTGHGLARERAYISDYSSEDTLYVHAHLLEMRKVDSVASLYKGLGNVRLYRKDIQAVSDSIIYNTADSLMNCLGHPFMWSGKSQVTGDSITIYLKGEGLERVHIRENAFASNQLDEKYFDQMRGREMMAYFSDNKMDSLWTDGNSEAIYISLSPDSVPQELTRTQSSKIFMLFENEEIVKIKMTPKTAARMTPVFLLESDQLTFPDFVWFPEGRPTGFQDIFRITPKVGGGTDKDEAEDSMEKPLLESDDALEQGQKVIEELKESDDKVIENAKEMIPEQTPRDISTTNTKKEKQ